MPVEQLKEFLPVPVRRPRLPRCEHRVVTNMGWREAMHREGRGRYAEGDPDQCTRDAVVKVDGVPMCRRHAGQVVLDKWLSGKLVEKNGA